MSIKIIERHEYAKDNLSIEQVIWSNGTKELHVLELVDDCLRVVEPNEDKFKEMVIYLHNMKHGLTK